MSNKLFGTDMRLEAILYVKKNNTESIKIDQPFTCSLNIIFNNF